MSRLQELLDELCPNGVEYLTTNDIKMESFWLMPSTPNYIEQGVPYITSKNVRNGQIDFSNVNYISEEDFKTISSNRNVKNGDILITMIGTIGEVCIVNTDVDFYGQNLYLVRLDNNKVLTKYYYYFITSKSVKNQLVTKKNASSQGYIKAGSIEKLLLPVPPLEVQREIVQILDKFTLLTDELTDELTARKKQYEYYRNQLIDNDKYPLVRLGDMATIIRGGNFQKKHFVEVGRPCIHYGQMYTHFGIAADNVIKYISEEVYNKSKIASKSDIVMAVTSENVEDVCSCTAWLGEEDIAVSGHTAIIKHNQNAKYLSYYFHTNHFFVQKVKLAHGTKVIEVTPSALNDILIPLPSIEEQDRIVGILDRFDKLCHDISTGIPAEIEVRKKQYEYYRDKLLSFKELGA